MIFANRMPACAHGSRGLAVGRRMLGRGLAALLDAQEA